MNIFLYAFMGIESTLVQGRDVGLGMDTWDKPAYN